jgi:transcriptional regulator with XRE-family HTH domain
MGSSVVTNSGRERSCGDDSSINGPNSVDRRVGRRIQMRRLLLEIELHHLAGDLGILASALARMEAGEERASPELVARIANYLGVSVSWFFRDAESEPVASPVQLEAQGAPAGLSGIAQPDVGTEMFELLDHFLQVDGADRQAILDYARQRQRKQQR